MVNNKYIFAMRHKRSGKVIYATQLSGQYMHWGNHKSEAGLFTKKEIKQEFALHADSFDLVTEFNNESDYLYTPKQRAIKL